MFFSHFCHNYHQNYHNYHHNYHCNHHYHHWIFFGHTRKTSFLTSKKRGPSCPNWGDGGGLGDSGNARKKTFFSYWCLPLQGGKLGVTEAILWSMFTWSLRMPLIYLSMTDHQSVYSMILIPFSYWGAIITSRWTVWWVTVSEGLKFTLHMNLESS